ncbi:HAMP domain-containing histidine kinase [Actinomadura graeca]|uniref:histidine kinase n=1 Tax=Actinomadura graeca TaxID=2750812 RepID=A0ABX8QZI3_9ACTN|nr:HAMP domain-containing sensor histidine kinase [Actinomadura graeca]QXJ22193.1 HAMP domain-containing histidine kinase [Actinomadura graeca]
MARRLLLSYLSLTLLVLLSLEVPFALTYAGEQRQRAARDLERQATVLAEFADEAIEEDEPDLLPRLAAEHARASGGRVVIVGRRGQVLAAAPASAGRGDPGDLPGIRRALAGHLSVGTHPSTDYYVAAPAASGPTIHGAVHLAVPTGRTDAVVHRMWLNLALAGVVVLALVALVGSALARSITRPLRSLERAADQLAGGTLTTPAATHLGPPEMRRVAATFNHTASRLQELLAAQRGFAADASHQLRTPLTALRLRLENLEPVLPRTGHADLRAAVIEIDRLAQMIDGLLDLARMHHDTHPEPVDLDAVLTSRARTWSTPAAAKHVRLTRTGAPTGPVWAIPGALEQILDNLLANALRAAPPGSTITLARHPAPQPRTGSAGMVALQVIDQGPGMTAAQRTRAFDRFWRAPDAPKGGSGLGLAIVQRLVQASGGHIDLHPAPGTGLAAAVHLRPATEADGRPSP